MTSPKSTKPTKDARTVFFDPILFLREVWGEASRMEMQLPTRRLPAAAAVLALAGAVVVVVGFQETMRRTELVGLRVQSPLLLYDVDPRTSGSTYYAEIAGQSQGELSGALEAAKLGGQV